MSKALRAEAADPTTSPARLKELAKQGCAREVAGNPNTPTPLLLKLVARHFEAFMENPVLPLLLLEDPGFCAKIPARALRRLLRRTDVPANFLQTLARHPDRQVRENARWHVAAEVQPEEVRGAVAEALRQMPPLAGQIGTLLALGLVPAFVLEPLAASSNARLRQQVVSYLQQATDPATVELRDFLTKTGAIANQRGVTRAQRDLSEAALVRLAAGGTRARWLAARHAATPPRILQQLASDPSRAIQTAALKNPAVPETVLWAFAGAPRVALRRAVALNVQTPAALLAQLAGDRVAGVRQIVASHWATPPDTLATLAGDAEPEVLLRVARHRMTPPAALAQLAASTHASVRVRVAGHRYLPPASRDQLAADPMPGVRGELARRGDLPTEILAKLLADREGQRDATFNVCYRNRRIPQEWKWQLSQREWTFDEAVDFLTRIARPPSRPPRNPAKPNPPKQWRPPARGHRTSWWDTPAAEKHHEACSPQTPVEDLQQLAVDDSYRIRRMVAHNSSTPPETLLTFVDDAAEEVRWFLACNTNCPVEALRRLAHDPVPKVRASVVANKATPPETIEALSGDPAEEVQKALARNEHTPPEVLRGFLRRGIELARALVGNPKLPEDVVRALAAMDDAMVVRDIAANPSLPADLARSYATDSRLEVRIAVAANRALPSAEAAALLTDSSADVRAALAARVPEAAMLEVLLQDPDPKVLVALAMNSKIDEETQARLARHPSGSVRAALAQNPAPSPAILRLLLADDDNQVISALTYCQHLTGDLAAEFALNHLSQPAAWYGLLSRRVLPVEVLEQAVEKGSPALLQYFSHERSLPESVYVRIARTAGKEQLVHFAMNPALPPAALDELADHAEEKVRYWAAMNPNISPAALLRLAHRGDMHGYYESRIRLRAAGHPGITGEDLRALFARELQWQEQAPRYRRRRYREEGSEGLLSAFVARRDLPVGDLEGLLDTDFVAVQRALLARPDLPADWRERLLDRTLQQCLDGVAPLARCCALLHPRAPQASLALALRQGLWIERWAMSQNPSCPLESLRELANDANMVVRTAARARLPQ